MQVDEFVWIVHNLCILNNDELAVWIFHTLATTILREKKYISMQALRERFPHLDPSVAENRMLRERLMLHVGKRKSVVAKELVELVDLKHWMEMCAGSHLLMASLTCAREWLHDNLFGAGYWMKRRGNIDLQLLTTPAQERDWLLGLRAEQAALLRCQQAGSFRLHVGSAAGGPNFDGEEVVDAVAGQQGGGAAAGVVAVAGAAKWRVKSAARRARLAKLRKVI
jgi:hypothetical protein